VAALVFPDNTVLINFAYIHRMDLLERLVTNAARCATIASECKESAAYPELEDLREARRIFGDPLFPESREEHVMTTTYRKLLSRPGDGPRKNLGEAETLAIIHCRGMSAVFFTDDKGPASIVAKPGNGGPNVSIAGTWTLLKVARKKGFIDDDTLWGYVGVLRNKQRAVPPGDAAYWRVAFDAWLSN
jgi:predicted nucleic acid-binding protein